MSTPSKAKHVTWSREQIVVCMLEYVGADWRPTMELAKLRNVPDYERIRQPDHYWRGAGPQPADFVEFDDPDAPITEMNSYLMPFMCMKRAVLQCTLDEERLRIWLWDFDGLHELPLDKWDDYKGNPNFEYRSYSFSISADLRKITYWVGEHSLGMRGWQLLVVENAGIVSVIDDPKGWMMMS